MNFAINIIKFVKKYRKILKICYTYTMGRNWEGTNVKKLQKRYYILLFVSVLAFGAIISDISRTSNFEIIKEPTAMAPEAESVIITADDSGDEMININTASVSELSDLPGIGEKIAERIIEYRTRNGDFEVIEDILKVSGIGEKKFEAIKGSIAVK